MLQTAELPPLNLTNAEEWVYVSPEQDIKAAFLHYIGLAQRSIHLVIFGFHIPPLTQALIDKHEAGLVVDGIFDHSQAQGKAEAPELLRFIRAGLPFLIGTSSRGGQLLHGKVAVIDEEWVWDGSWNFSLAANDQFNTVRVTRSKELAHRYLQERDKLRAYIMRHEAIFQPKRAKTPAAALAEDVGHDAELDPKPDAGQVRRRDLAAPWLDNPPLHPAVEVTTPSGHVAGHEAPAKPRTRKRKVREATA